MSGYKEYSFLVNIKEVTTHRVYVKARTKKAARKMARAGDIEHWGRIYNIEAGHIVSVMNDDLKDKALWRDR